MELNNETKVLLGILVATILIIVGGAYLAGRGQTTTNQPITAEESSRLVRADDPTLGPAEAEVTVVEFGDFQCPACGALHPVLKQTKEQYADQSVRFVYRQFPLTQIHEHAQLAAEASLAAQAQGAFWEYHDLLYENQSALEKEDLVQYAEELELDVEAFETALDDGTYKDAVQQDIADARALRLSGTPSLFIDGAQYQGQYSVNSLGAAIDAALNES